MENKVKFGLKNVHVWPIEKVETTGLETKVIYGDVIKIPGAVAVNFEAAGDEVEFYADNIKYFSQFVNAGYTGDFEMALIPEAFEIKIMDNKKDDNGAIGENVNAKPKNYALAFEFDGDKHETRHIMYNCSSSRPGVTGKTKEKSVEPQTDKLSITANAAEDTGNIKYKIAKGLTGYDAWFEKPYIPVITEEPTPEA